MAQEESIKIEFDGAINEQVILAAAMVDQEVRRNLLLRIPNDRFIVEGHAASWGAIRELDRKGLEFDLATLVQFNASVDTDYLGQLLDARPEVPPNLEFHVQQLMWDYARVEATRGPITALLEAIKDPRTEPERVRALARQVPQAFEGYEERKYLRDPEQLIQEQMLDIDERIAGRAVYTFGVEGLDRYEDGSFRLVPGAKPGKTTIVTGVSGSGKSTFTSRVVLGLARQRIPVLVGAWEMDAGTSLELLGCMSLEMSRTRLMTGQLSKEERDALEERMRAISRYVRFMEKPVKRRPREWQVEEKKGWTRRRNNDENLDLLQQYISDTGVEVFVGDLFKRLLVAHDPEQEEEALIRWQTATEELRIHSILVQQQRLKDIELRPDKRPTREGIKGSAAWVEVADNIFGCHRPALWKAIPDNVVEIDVLKQRYGKWPLAVEFDWDPERGSFTKGRSIPYDQPGDNSAGESSPINRFPKPKRK